MESATPVVPHIDDSGNRPVVAGTDIKVSQIASEAEHLGMTPDEIVLAACHATRLPHRKLAKHFNKSLPNPRFQPSFHLVHFAHGSPPPNPLVSHDP